MTTTQTFIETQCQVAPAIAGGVRHRMEVGLMYRGYVAWADKQNLAKVEIPEFRIHLKDLGFKESKLFGTLYSNGVRLNPDTLEGCRWRSRKPRPSKEAL